MSSFFRNSKYQFYSSTYLKLDNCFWFHFCYVAFAGNKIHKFNHKLSLILKFLFSIFFSKERKKNLPFQEEKYRRESLFTIWIGFKQLANANCIKWVKIKIRPIKIQYETENLSKMTTKTKICEYISSHKLETLRNMQFDWLEKWEHVKFVLK